MNKTSSLCRKNGKTKKEDFLTIQFKAGKKYLVHLTSSLQE
jgi:hypothetical protein